MNVVRKLVLTPDGINHYRLPVDCQYLHVAQQGQNICLWYRVNCETDRTAMRRIFVYTTGVQFPAEYKFIGTVLYNSGELVFHVLEEI